MRFQVLTAVSMKMTVFWDVVPCSLAKFTDISEVLTAFIISLMTEAVSTSQKKVIFLQQDLFSPPKSDCRN
jgi:hypothetical protein